MNARANHMSMGIPVLHWSRGIVFLARYDVTGCTGGCHFDNCWCSRCCRFRRRFCSCVLRFGDNSVDSRFVAVIQRYGSDEHNNYYGKKIWSDWHQWTTTHTSSSWARYGTFMIGNWSRFIGGEMGNNHLCSCIQLINPFLVAIAEET